MVKEIEEVILNSEYWHGDETLAGQVHTIADELALHLRIIGEVDQPNLGLATTRELLEELATRMEVTQNSTAGRELGVMCRKAVENLQVGVLQYRTVNR